MKNPRQTEILYGIHPVTEALAAGRRQFLEILTVTQKTGRRMDAIVQMARNLGIPVKNTSHRELSALAGSDMHQGVGARTTAFPVTEWSEILSGNPAASGKSAYLLIDSLSDPHNLGALIRTALCFGINSVIIPKDRSVAPTPTVSKTSAGALEHIRLARVTNLVYAINDLKKAGVWTYGLDATGDRPIFTYDLTGDIAVVVGGEDAGIRPLVKKSCDFLCRIPQSGPVASLNASVAGGMAMYEVFRQRNTDHPA
jgi:23S rRNA (guanosine2251-2'-O)-methyltransferase